MSFLETRFNGNFLILNIKLNACDTHITLAAVHGPNETEIPFFIQLVRQLELCDGGDWNAPQDYRLNTNIT